MLVIFFLQAQKKIANDGPGMYTKIAPKSPKIGTQWAQPAHPLAKIDSQRGKIDSQMPNIDSQRSKIDSQMSKVESHKLKIDFL